MLNIGKLAHGGAEYYLTTVASSVEAYYTGAGEAPGRWAGTGSVRLGLAGLVTPETLRGVLAGKDPAGGEPLVGAARTVPGFDLRFRAPKSVSLLWALAGPDTSREVRHAYDVAVDAALDYLERHAAHTRRGKAGHEQVQVDGFVAAAFRHRTSRADDPLLHTHVLVANLAYTKDDGTWRSLDARHLYLHAKTAGYLYQAQLRAELCRRLDVAFGPIVNGTADLDGIPRGLIEAFSRRRDDILAARGLHSARGRPVATLTTRTAKSHADADGLQAGWRQRAAGLGFGARQLADVLHAQERHAPAKAVAGRQVDEGAAWLLSPRGLTAKASTFTRRDTLRGWCERLRHGADVTVVERLADRLLDDSHAGTIRLTGTHTPIRQLTDAPGIRLADGRLVTADAGEARYTTPELLAVAQHLIDTAVRLLDAGRATVDATTVGRAVAARPSLTGEQHDAVGQLTRSGHGVEVHGEVAAAIDAYRTNGRLVTADTADAVREQLVGDWWLASVEHGTDAVMVAARGSDIDDLNARARTRLEADGRLTGRPLDTAGGQFRVGDRLLCLRNHRTVGVLNGTRGTVTRVDHLRGELTVRRDDTGVQVALPSGYLDAGHATHGSALTAHKAQGLTCEQAFVLGDDEIYREWGYVAMSRGWTDNRLYLVAGDLELPDDPTHPEVHQRDTRTPAERVIADLRRSHQQTLALDHLTDRRSNVQAAAAPARHLTLALGPRPDDPDRQQTWDAAAAGIDTYRSLHGIDDDRLPLGVLPDDAEARAAYRQATRALLTARRALRTPAIDTSHDRVHDLGRDVA